MLLLQERARPLYFIDVILPLPLKQTFTYQVNQDEARFLKPGMRVVVPFGKRKIQTGMVFSVHRQAPMGYQTKSIDHIIDHEPVVHPKQLEFWQWMASYYMCSLGEVMRAALPGSYLLESETVIHLDKAFQGEESVLSDAEFQVLEALAHSSSLHIDQLRSLLDRRDALAVIGGLLQNGVIRVQETIYEKYRPKIKRFVKLAEAYQQEDSLRTLLDDMSRAPKQRDLLMHLFMLQAKGQAVSVPELLKRSGAANTSLNALRDKGVVLVYEQQVDRYEFLGTQKGLPELSRAQTKAYEQILHHFKAGPYVLLQGVTGSGKTAIYTHLIQQTLEAGMQVLYMLPEIALTTQLIERLKVFFGKRLAVYHSRQSMHERVEVWQQVLEGKGKAGVVVGARSSMFLPFSNLGLIILDEEHEPSFKQHQPAPRYHARDAALVLAGMQKARVLMGSATPSLESLYLAREGKYNLVTLNERYGRLLLPQIQLVDLQRAYKRKQMKGHFSTDLIEAIAEVLDMGKQVILFQNRRGYAPVVQCQRCGTAPQCPNCDVSLTYHQFKNQLRCHYCGYHRPMLSNCMACGSTELDSKGFGTQQIETEIQELFPEASIARMDQDTTKGKHAYARLIERMENQQIDILVGTQMLAKGLDFHNVQLVGVLMADQLLNFPDFRAHERTYQLLSQVSGRSGRVAQQGKVLIQSFHPEHQILQQVSGHRYAEMAEEQLEERYQFKYPPYYRMIRITLRHRNAETVQKASGWLAAVLRTQLEDAVLGPVAPAVARVRNEYIRLLLIKLDKQAQPAAYKRFIEQVLQKFDAQKEFARVKRVVDVDPV